MRKSCQIIADHHAASDRRDIDGIGEHSGPNRATGRPMRARVAHLWQGQRGLVRRLEQSCDTLLAHQAV